MNYKNFNLIYIGLWATASLVAFFLQVVFAAAFSEETIWGYAPGWQREIALWNLGIVIIVFIIILKRNHATAKTLVLLLTVISFLLGLNHAAALFSGIQKWGNILGVSANLIASIIGIIVLWIQREKSAIA